MSKKQSKEPKPGNPTIAEALNEVERLIWSSHKDSEGRRRLVEQVVADMRNAVPNTLTWDPHIGFLVLPSTLGAILHRLHGRGLQASTINRTMSALRAVVDGSRRLGMHDFTMPPVPFLKERAGRTRVVSVAEFQELLNKLPSTDSRHLVTLLYHTGLRVSEALRLQWADVDLERGSILVRESKNGEQRSVKMTSAFLAYMRLQVNPRSTGSLVFPGLPQSTFNAAWATARRGMGLEDDVEFVPHALRHTCATRLVLAGVPLPVVQKWMGHKSIHTTMRYVHVHDDAIDDAAERLERLTR